jgi:hypothetical protein
MILKINEKRRGKEKCLNFTSLPLRSNHLIIDRLTLFIILLAYLCILGINK